MRRRWRCRRPMRWIATWQAFTRHSAQAVMRWPTCRKGLLPTCSDGRSRRPAKVANERAPSKSVCSSGPRRNRRRHSRAWRLFARGSHERSRIHPCRTAGREPAHATGGGRRRGDGVVGQAGIRRRTRGARHRAPRPRGHRRSCCRAGQRRRRAHRRRRRFIVRCQRADRAAVDRVDRRARCTLHRALGAARDRGRPWPAGRAAARSRGIADTRSRRVSLPAHDRCVRVRCRRHCSGVRRPRTLRRVSDRRRLGCARADHARRAARLRLRHRRLGARRACRFIWIATAERRFAGAHTYHVVGRARADGGWRRRSGVRRVGQGAGAGGPRCGNRPWCRAVRPAAAGASRAGSGQRVRRGRALHDRAGGSSAGVTAGVLRTRGRRPGEVRARRLRGWSLVPLRRIARCLRCGPPSHQPRRHPPARRGAVGGVSADRRDACSRAAAPPLEMLRNGCSTARS